MQTYKLNNLLQDQSLWLERCVTLNISITQASSQWTALSVMIWFQYEHPMPTSTYCSFFLLVFVYCPPPPPSSSCHWYEPLPNSNPRGQWVGGGGYRYHPNLVPRSHSVLHWKVRSPFPLAVGDLGTRLVSPKKATCVLLIFNFAETATLQGGGKIFKTMFCFSWEDRRAN